MSEMALGAGATVRPADAEEVSQLVRRAVSDRRRLVPVGTGRHLDPSCALGDRTAVSTEGLTGVEAYEPADLTVTAGAGTLVGRLAEELEPHRQWLPFDPPDAVNRTLGGLVATGLSGPLGTGYGALRNHVLGATVVCGNGRTLRLGGRVVKNVAGFDLLRPVVGSRGSLGVVTSVTLRLFPVPPVDRLLLFRTQDAASALEAARAVATAPVLPASVVLEVRDGACDLLVRLHGAAETVAADQRTLEAHSGVVFERLDGEAAAGRNEATRDRGWAEAIVLRARARPGRLGAVVEALSPLGPRAFVADVCDGSVRVGLERASADALADCRARIEGLGGSIWAERGPRAVGAALAQRRADGVRRLIQGVRKVFDPDGVFSQEDS
jgi:glycolate dehydrogenase FAD-binding subunit